MTIAYDVVFCDDMRQEINGKYILIGVYGPDLIPGHLPQTIPLAVWLSVKDLEYGQHKFKFSLEINGNEAGVEGEFQLDPQSPSKSAVFGFGPIPIQVDKPGTVVARMSINDAEASEVGSLNVTAPRQK